MVQWLWFIVCYGMYCLRFHALMPPAHPKTDDPTHQAMLFLISASRSASPVPTKSSPCVIPETLRISRGYSRCWVVVEGLGATSQTQPFDDWRGARASMRVWRQRTPRAPTKWCCTPFFSCWVVLLPALLRLSGGAVSPTLPYWAVFLLLAGAHFSCSCGWYGCQPYLILGGVAFLSHSCEQTEVDDQNGS